jgi:hypothetical protein
MVAEKVRIREVDLQAFASMKPNPGPVARDGGTEPLSLEEYEQLQAVVNRAEAGDTTALPTLRAYLVDPRAARFLRGLVYQTEQATLRAAAGQNLAYREIVEYELQVLRKELAGPNASPLERLLVERITMTYLQVQLADTKALAGGPEWDCAFNERRRNAAHRRHLSAIRALALVRKLAMPVLRPHAERSATAAVHRRRPQRQQITLAR